MSAVKTISFTLDKRSIGNAIREVKKFRDEFPKKVSQLREMIGNRIYWSASIGFRVAIAGDIISGEAPQNDVRVTVDHGDRVTVVIASGEQAVFIEYGAGVYHNGNVGSSPHPWGEEKGFLIGTYGKGKGAKNVWGYYPGGDKAAGLVLTHGTPAAAPMYNGWQEAMMALDEMIMEVFG